MTDIASFGNRTLAAWRDPDGLLRVDQHARLLEAAYEISALVVGEVPDTVRFRQFVSAVNSAERRVV
jgi:hypothetical protein